MPERQAANAYHLGLIDYQEAWDLQQKLVRKRQEDQIPDTLLTLEHPPVITLGRAAKPEHLLLPEEVLRQRGFSIYSIERGGDVTYHGPGQLVAYPILDLTAHGQDLHRYLRDLEDVVIRTLACYNVTARRDARYTGVWVGDEKICAIGVAVKRWVSFHGLALNLNSNLDHFRVIVPCGIREYGVTSLARILGSPVDEAELLGRFLDAFTEVFSLQITASGGRGALLNLA